MREVTLNWVQSQQTTMTAFLSLYTLHDAEMRECALLVDGSAVLTFVWDRVWLEVPFAQTHLSAPQEPWLFLQFPHVLMATIDDTAADRTYENGTVASGDSTLLNLEQRERLRAMFALLRLMEPASSTSSEPGQSFPRRPIAPRSRPSSGVVSPCTTARKSSCCARRQMVG